MESTFKSNHTELYWQYEYDVAARYMIPLLSWWGVKMENTTVLDVGCGEGGGLCALHDEGAKCIGFDIDAPRVASANALQGKRNIPMTTGDLYSEALPFKDDQFDLVVLHDVFEHLEQKDDMLQKLQGYMKETGKLMITFPPYYSAYGAHQQLLHSTIAKLPFFHLIPFALKCILPLLKSEEKYVVEEVQKLGRLKMGMKKFEEIAHRNGMEIVGKQAYLIGPNHIRFGFKPIPADKIAEIPLLGEMLCTGVVYLLSKS